ncbi:hypothetical protein ZIOFF_034310 [Zingiber officinale]|uniref:DUF7795 domain-containing protein n=1 Tax=Zingiber officinale TaxID=94328 RepID=A0A8J5L7J1_ZINOF|nr:hypothetical protein ZIOFF_034310 [Zingiber officinale]
MMVVAWTRREGDGGNCGSSKLLASRGEAAAVEKSRDGTASTRGEHVRSCFLHEIHICRVTEFEELADVGKRFLTRFNREHQSVLSLAQAGQSVLVAYQSLHNMSSVAMFRTVELQKTSNNISRIIDANWNEHMKTYVEAGCKQQSQSVQNMYNSEALLNELDCLKEDAIAVTEAATKSATALDDSFCEEMLKDISFEEEKEPLPKHPQDTSISEVMLMKIISDMLKLDYAMQKNIVLNLNIGTSVSELEGYCLLWNLHPYIDDDIIHRAWQYVPSHDQSSR